MTREFRFQNEGNTSIKSIQGDSGFIDPDEHGEVESSSSTGSERSLSNKKIQEQLSSKQLDAIHASIGPESRDHQTPSENDLCKRFTNGYELLGSVSSPMLVRQEELDEMMLRERQLNRKKQDLTDFKIKLILIKSSKSYSSDTNARLDLVNSKNEESDGKSKQSQPKSQQHKNHKQIEFKKA